jgi:hypothetical protein
VLILNPSTRSPHKKGLRIIGSVDRIEHLAATYSVILNMPDCVGVPDNMPLPLPPVNVTPLGRAPLSVTVGVGNPLAVTLNVPPVPRMNAVLFPLVMAGA